MNNHFKIIAYTVPALFALASGCAHAPKNAEETGSSAVDSKTAFVEMMKVAPTAAGVLEPVYIATDLGTLGGEQSYAEDINNYGQVVGSAYTADWLAHVTLFNTQGASNINLDKLVGRVSWGSGINDRGQVIGTIWVSNDTYHATLFDVSEGSMTDLGTLGGSASSPTDINNNGQTVGGAFTTENQFWHATLFGSAGKMATDLGTLGGSGSIARDINNFGHIVGEAMNVNGDGHATLFGINGEANSDLGTLGGNTSAAYGINDNGQVIGCANLTDSGNPHATIFNVTSGSNINLDTSGYEASCALGINNRGEIVGYFSELNGTTNAFIWASGEMKSLDSLIESTSGIHLIRAQAINDLGQIVGWGRNDKGETHAFLLTPKYLNHPPIANAGPNTSAKKGSTLTLDGSASTDPDGISTITSYVWIAPGMPTLNGVNPKQAFTKIGTYTYTLTVTDIKGATSTDQVVVKVFDANYSQVYLRGTHNNWGNAASAKMTLVGNNTWQADAVFSKATNEVFKFDINGDWKLNFGNNNTDNVADQNGKNIKITKGAGTYRIVFNDKTKVYSVTKK